MSTDDLTPGNTLGAWVIDEVASLGQPTLVRCHHRDTPTRRAILKVTRQHRMAQTWQDREVRALQSLTHPAIPRFLDSGRQGRLLFIAVSPFATTALAECLYSGAPERGLVLAWALHLAGALHHMHESGWVHGDVHPRNVFVDERGQAWLMGLTSARTPDDPGRFREEIPEGNYTYLAPEALQPDGERSARSDQYALGCLLYQLLTGEPPFPAAAFAGRHDQALMFLEWKQRQRELDPGDAHPDWLRVLVRTCTRADATLRYPDLSNAIAMLEVARTTWAPEQAALLSTPLPAERQVPLEPLQLQPALDAEAIAHRVAESLARQQPPPPQPSADTALVNGMLWYVAGSAGMATGLALSLLVILYAELVRIG